VAVVAASRPIANPDTARAMSASFVRSDVMADTP
jgi:hypothetical protein